MDGERAISSRKGIEDQYTVVVDCGGDDYQYTTRVCVRRG